MKAICKKLLSLLVVIAMVLSMVPFGGLGIFAVETNATTTETVTPGSASVADDVQKHIDEVKANIQSLDPATVAAGTTCPMCGATDITWTPTTGALGAKADGAAYHYYMAGEINVSNSAYNWAVVRGIGTKMCLLLDDAVLTGGGTIGAGGTDCTLNIMGTGTLTSTGANSQDYGLVKSNGTRSTVNLYGGTYIYTGAARGTGTVPVYGAVLVGGGTSAVANIYDGVVVGPETVTNTAPLYNVRIEKGTLNMYGGTVRNGVTEDWGYSGNVSIASNGTLNMYGGTISGGNYVADHDDVVAASVGGNVLIGACVWNKDQGKAISSNGNFNMYGGTVTGGTCRNGGNGGGNICVMGASVCQITGGTVSNGTARTRGGNIQAQAGTTTIGGTALIADGTAQYGGNLDVTGGTVTINDSATLSGGVATFNGGSIYVKEGKALTMTGGTVTGGKVEPTSASTVGGGNVYVNATTDAGQATFTMTGGEISDGKAYYFVKTNDDNTTSNVGGYGGNIHGQGNVVIEGGKIYGGYAQMHGGNLSVSTGASLTISDGEIYGGVAEAQAGNIRSWQAPVTISGGYIHDGEAKGKGSTNHNVWVQGGSATSGHSLTISGGTIAGDTKVGNGPLTLSGAPVITAGKSIGLQTAGDPADISGLTEGASIVVTAKAGDVLTAASDNAVTAAAYFTCSDSTLMVVAAADNTLVVQDAPVKETSKDVFDPWNYDGMAYCPVCLENGTATEPVEWIAVNSATTAFTMGQNKHYYLSEDITNAQVVADKNSGVSYIQATWGAGVPACLHLNGKNLTVTNGAAIFGSTGIMNIMGDGVVSGNRTSGNGSNAATILLNSSKAAGTINLYGGTYTKAATSQNAIISIQGNGGTINMYDGAVIDGTGLTNTNYPVGVNLLGGIYDATDNPHGGIATFNMYGGEIKNGTNTEGPGGNVMVGAGSSTAKTIGAAVFNMYGGTISGGTAAYGGNVFLRTGCSFNQHGGIIKGGKTTAADSYYGGGNIAIITGVYLLQDGIIADGETNLANKNAAGGNVYMRENTFIMTGGTISGGKSGTNTGGGSVYLTGKAALVVSGGTISGGEVTGTAGGGNIGVWSGTAEIKGDAQILNGKGNGYGGNIYIGTGDAANKLTISENAVISGGEGNYGGNIALLGKVNIAPSLQITGGTIKDGTALYQGGNIYMAYGSHEISNATISGGNAIGKTVTDEETGKVTYSYGNGGNIFATGGTENVITLNLGGLTVSDGTALQYGGNAYIDYAEVNILDGIWNGGEVTVWHGGNLSIMRSKAQINGTTISGGKALNAQGGALRCYMCEDVQITDATITGGEAKTNSCVWFATDSSSHATPETVTKCNVTITDSSITSIDDQPAVSAGAGVTVTLDGNTTAVGDVAFTTQKYTIASEVEGEEPTVIIESAKLVVKDTWTGEAQVSLGDYYYAGDSISADHAEATGAFTGKLTNAKGTEAPILLGETLYLPAYGVVTEESAQWFGTAEEALTAYAAAEGTKYLVAGADIALAGQEIYLDACNDIKVTGTGTVYGIDPDNDAYKRATGTITAEGVTLVGDVTFNGNRYIKIADGSYHRIEMGIRNITLRTSAAGLYYNAYYTCDKTLAAVISSYGVVVSVNDLPGADFQNAADDHFSVYEDFAAQYEALESGYTVAANSTSVFGIMKDTNSAADNAAHGEMDIYANAYIVIGGEKIYVADEANAGQKAGVAYSLHDVMTAMDNEEFWNSLALEDQVRVNEFYTLWNEQGGMADWTFENIKLVQNG